MLVKAINLTRRGLAFPFMVISIPFLIVGVGLVTVCSLIYPSGNMADEPIDSGWCS